eukprot:tig00020553_g10675.t1
MMDFLVSALHAQLQPALPLAVQIGGAHPPAPPSAFRAPGGYSYGAAGRSAPALGAFGRWAFFSQQARPVIGPAPSVVPPAAASDDGRLRLCRNCQGKLCVACKVCSGRGTLAKGGFHSRRNPIREDRLVDSKWTSAKPVVGWRHFRVLETMRERREEGGKPSLRARLQATCAPDTTVWIDAEELKSRDAWIAGWITKEELTERAARAATTCPSCRGRTVVPCPRCKGAGVQ